MANRNYSRATRIGIHERDNFKCWVCGSRVVLDSPDEFTQATIDHVLPLSHGGTNYHENLSTACRWCNEQRGKANEAPEAIAKKRSELLSLKESVVSHIGANARLKGSFAELLVGAF